MTNPIRLACSALVVCAVALGGLTAATGCSSSSSDVPADGALVSDSTSGHDAASHDVAVPLADAAARGDAAKHPVPPPLPLIPNHGGPIIAKPEIVTVTWNGDPLQSSLEAFDAWWVTSATWTTMMAEWGVGPGTHLAVARITEAAPPVLDDAGIAALLERGFADGSIPAPNGSRIYTFYPPAGTAVSSLSGTGCVDFQAYHFFLAAPATDAGTGATAYYAVAPRCANTQGMAPLDYVTWGQSHEVIEAASDPQYGKPAWLISDQSVATPQLGENADLCVGQPTTVEGHMITRNWSNVAAKAGARPCVPAPPGRMFGLFAEPAEITLDPAHPSKVTVYAYTSDGSSGPFAVGAFAGDPNVTATLDKNAAADGDVLTLTVTAKAGFAEQDGANVVYLEAASSDYSTNRFLIVHAKP